MANRTRPVCNECDGKMQPLYTHNNNEYKRAAGVFECSACGVIAYRSENKVEYVKDKPVGTVQKPRKGKKSTKEVIQDEIQQPNRIGEPEERVDA